MSGLGVSTPAGVWVDRSVDAVAALALTAIVLTGLDTTFVDRYYLVVGLVGAAVCVLAAVMSVEGSIAGFLLGGLVAFILVGTMLVEGEAGALAAPTGSALLEFLRESVTGTVELLTTIPPLDSSGGALAVPYELGFLTAGLAALIALRTRRALLPVLPVLLCLVVVSLVSSLETSGVVVRGALLAGGALLWGVVRASRVARPGTPPRDRWVRPVVALAVVLPAILVGAAVARDRAPEDPATLRGVVGRGADIDPRDNPLILFRQYTRQRPGVPTVYGNRLMRVDGLPAGTPIRFVALDVYDGTAWRAGNRTVGPGEDDLYQRIGSEIYTRRPGRTVAVEVDLTRHYARGWLPQSDQLTSVTFNRLDGLAQREDVRYNPATSSALVEGGLIADDDYRYTAVVPRDRLEPHMSPYPASGELQPAGARLDRLLRPWRRSGLSPMRQVFDLAAYLRENGRYSDGAGDPTVPPGHDLKRLTKGFFGADRIVGDDEQYAAFMALAANRLGVPARVVVGAIPRGPVVRGRHVSAWVEIRVGDGSWRRMPTATFMSHRWALPPDAPDRPELPAQPRPQTQDQTARPEPPESADSQSQADPATGAVPWWAALAVLVAALVPASKLARRVWRRGHGQPATRVAAGWRELLDTAADVGRAPAPGLTRIGQAAALGVSVDLATLADRLVFGPRAAHAADASDFWRRLPAERRAVVRGAGRLRRLVAWWNPRSLVTRFGAVLPGRSRRSRSPESAGPAAPTSRPTPARAPRATRARAGR